MNKTYAERHENEDYQLLEELNSVFKLQQLGRTPLKHQTDASGYTANHQYIEIELKRRYINKDTFGSIIIEPYKLKYAKEHKNIIQLYVNFTNDNCAIVFNLTKIDKPNKTELNIPSQLYERTKMSNRYELPITQAWIYQKTNNTYKLIQKGLK